MIFKKWNAFKVSNKEFGVMCGGQTIASIMTSWFKSKKQAEEISTLIASAPEGIKTAIWAYASLLTISGTDAWRIKNDELYAGLRDYIATATSADPEKIQAFYELVAVELSKGISLSKAIEIISIK